MADYIYLVQLDVPAELEDEFNRIYDEEHVPYLLEVPGVHRCARYRLERTNREGMEQYAAIYEIDSPDLVNSPTWKEQSDKGDWVSKIRPHVTSRHHSLFKKVVEHSAELPTLSFPSTRPRTFGAKVSEALVG